MDDDLISVITPLDALQPTRVPGATYNADDLNIVSECMEYVAQRLCDVGYDVTVDTRRYERTDFPTVSVMLQYIEQIRKLHDVLLLLDTTPPVPGVSRDRPYLTVQEANDIERILLDVDEIIRNIIDSWYYAGDLYAGEV